MGQACSCRRLRVEWAWNCLLPPGWDLRGRGPLVPAPFLGWTNETNKSGSEALEGEGWPFGLGMWDKGTHCSKAGVGTLPFFLSRKREGAAGEANVGPTELSPLLQASCLLF